MMATAETRDPLFIELQTALAGRYSLERELGRGGMGVVYLARDVQLDRPVAIKLLLPAYAERPEIRQMLIDEARIAARLSHPNIVPIFSVEEVGRFAFFAMAFIPGETLGTVVRTQGPLPSQRAVRVLREIAWALSYAHDAGVIHRDLKPDNILLEEGSGRALLTDFGIARRAADDGFAVGSGTAGFMSPEQARGEPGDARSDLYSFGVTARFVFAGQIPPGSPRRPEGRLPAGIERMIEQCLSPDPAHRPDSSREVVAALDTEAGRSATLPPVLRRWLTRATPFRVAFSAWSVFFGFATLASVVLPTFTAADLVYWLGLTFAPWVLVFPLRLKETQRVLQAGYSLEDLRTALRLTLEQRREELLADFHQDRAALPQVRRKVWRTSAALGGGLLLLILVVFQSPAERSLLAGWTPFFVLILVVLLLLALSLRTRRGPPRDLGSELRYRIWNGPIGGWLAAAAGWGLRGAVASAPFSQRPTELVLGQAARGLFDALPAPVRRELAAYPETLRALEADALRLRNLLREVGPSDGDLTAAEPIGARYQEVIGSLEALRLGLLRLHAGSGSVQGVTTDLAAAAQLAAHVDRLVAAKSEVGRLLDPERHRTR